MVEKKIIDTAIELTKNIPPTDGNVSENDFDNGTTCNNGDVLVPLQLEESDLTPYPKSEYEVVVEQDLDKFNRKINQLICNWWYPTWGVNVVQTTTWTRFYQAMERWNVDIDEKPEMPSGNSEAGTMGPKPLLIPGLEDEPDLYEDIDKDVTNW